MSWSTAWPRRARGSPAPWKKPASTRMRRRRPSGRAPAKIQPIARQQNARDATCSLRAGWSEEREDQRGLGEGVNLVRKQGLPEHGPGRSRGRERARGRVLIVLEGEAESKAQTLPQRGGQARLADDARVLECAHAGLGWIGGVERLLVVEVEQRLDAGGETGVGGESEELAHEDAGRMDGDRVDRLARLLDVLLVREVVAELGHQGALRGLLELAAVARLAAAVELLAGDLVGTDLGQHVERVVLGEKTVVAAARPPLVGRGFAPPAHAGDHQGIDRIEHGNQDIASPIGKLSV